MKRLCLLLLILSISTLAEGTQLPDSAHSKYVSSDTCAQCHRPEHKQWLGSHHEKALQVASAETVLGDFDHATFNYHGELTRFYKKNGKHFIHTLGPDGKRHNYAVKFTFGISPLQQYLIELPGGRLQAFTIAWDTAHKKWFHLHPKKVAAFLHWSKPFYNWNSNCAECHSTHFQKNYDPKTKTYHSTWASKNVSCQACHGPGEKHVQWAKNKLKGKVNTIKNKGLIKRYRDINVHEKIEMCAACHSRRHAISPQDQHGEPLFDHFMPALLRDDLYHPDGQIKDEVFVYGSFLQSKMYRAGVSCMDCHNPHTLKLTRTGNGVCTQCHNNSVKKRFSGLAIKDYNSLEHSHHPVGSAGAKCVNCHMPEKTYMQIDQRRDHSFRIPRPDLTEKIGTPNACNQCHVDKSAAWALSAIQQWFGKKKYPQHFGEVFAKARGRKHDVERELTQLTRDTHQSDIVIATAIHYLAQYNTPSSVKTKIDALRSQNVLVRETALKSLAQLPMKERVAKLAPHLKDPARAVRIEAASILASAPKESISTKYHQALKQAIDEYESLQKANLDMPSSYLNLGVLYQKQSKYKKAISAYKQAIGLDKHFYPAPLNLAMLYNALDRNNKAEQVLHEAIAHNKKRGELYYSLGLLLAEQQKMKPALSALAQASRLLPQNSRVQYNYALALQSRGDVKGAEKSLTKAYQLNPTEPDIVYALAILHAQQKHWRQALHYAKVLNVLFPKSKKIQTLIKYIESKK